MNKNDEKIKELLKEIEDKKAKMGERPRGGYKGNGVIGEKNLNTVNSIEACIGLAAMVIDKRESYLRACKYLGIDGSVEIDNNELEDIKLRLDIIKWDFEKKKLSIKENKLKELRSLDAKTEDEIEEIMKGL